MQEILLTFGKGKVSQQKPREPYVVHRKEGRLRDANPFGNVWTFPGRIKAPYAMGFCGARRHCPQLIPTFPLASAPTLGRATMYTKGVEEEVDGTKGE